MCFFEERTKLSLICTYTYTHLLFLAEGTRIYMCKHACIRSEKNEASERGKMGLAQHEHPLCGASAFCREPESQHSAGLVGPAGWHGG